MQLNFINKLYKILFKKKYDLIIFLLKYACENITRIFMIYFSLKDCYPLTRAYEGIKGERYRISNITKRLYNPILIRVIIRLNGLFDNCKLSKG